MGEQKQEELRAVRAASPRATTASRFRKLALSIGALILVAPAPAWAISFDRHDVVATGFPYAIQSADFTSDGLPDLIAQGDDGLLDLYVGRGDANFRAPRHIPAGLFNSRLEVADFDLDGDADVAAVDDIFPVSSMRVLLGDGQGGFELESIVGEGYNPLGIASGDLDEDGVPDLMFTGTADRGKALIVLRGQGDGDFDPPTAFDGPGLFDVAAGDLNRDGHLDAVTASAHDQSSGQSVKGSGIFLGAGDGSVAYTGLAPMGKESPMLDIELADLDLDGSLDVVASETDSGVWTALGRGDGTFEAATNHRVGEYNTAVEVGDLDRDGIADVVATGDSPAGVTVLFGAGDGGFGERLVLGLGGDGREMEIDDLDGNGGLDVAVYGLPDGVRVPGSMIWVLRQSDRELSCAGRTATVLGARGRDRLTVPWARDVATMRGGNDVLRMRAGRDVVCAGGGDDKSYGGAGDDVLRGERGRDLLVGAEGADLLRARDGARDIVSCGPGRDLAVVDRHDVSRDCEQIQRR